MTISEDWEDMLKLSATNKEHNNKKEEEKDAARDPTEKWKSTMLSWQHEAGQVPSEEHKWQIKNHTSIK